MQTDYKIAEIIRNAYNVYSGGICALRRSEPRMNAWTHINRMNWCQISNYLYVLMVSIVRVSTPPHSNDDSKKMTMSMQLNEKRLMIQFIVSCTSFVCHFERWSETLWGETTQRPNQNVKKEELLHHRMKEHQRSRLYWLIVENRVNMSDTKISHEGHFITLNLAGALYAQHSSAPHGNVCYAYLHSLSVQCTRLYVHAWVRACVCTCIICFIWNWSQVDFLLCFVIIISTTSMIWWIWGSENTEKCAEARSKHIIYVWYLYFGNLLPLFRFLIKYLYKM